MSGREVLVIIINPDYSIDIFYNTGEVDSRRLSSLLDVESMSQAISILKAARGPKNDYKIAVYK